MNDLDLQRLKDAAFNEAIDKCAQIAQGNGAYATARTIRAYRRKEPDCEKRIAEHG